MKKLFAIGIILFIPTTVFALGIWQRPMARKIELTGLKTFQCINWKTCVRKAYKDARVIVHYFRKGGDLAKRGRRIAGRHTFYGTWWRALDGERSGINKIARYPK